MEASNPCISVYRAQEPYPEVRIEGRHNQRYAEAMLSNVAGGISEMTAIGGYLYDHLVTEGIPELSAAFHEISVVEMHHLQIFALLAQQLGADPRLWCVRRGRRSWWSPSEIQYTRKLGPLIQNAIRTERLTIQKYQGQLRWIQDQGIAANLRRIILDEECHVELLTCLGRAYGGMGQP